jgi:hypothetical protein
MLCKTEKMSERTFKGEVAEMMSSRSLLVSTLVTSKAFPTEACTMHLIYKTFHKISAEKDQFNVK